jgi:hypothetical protein
MSAEPEDQAPREPAHDTGLGWRAASLWALGLAMICAAGLYDELSGPRDPDWVTGAALFFALLLAQGVTCIAGIIFGMLEMHRPFEQRDRWNGLAMWANVLFAFGVVSWITLWRSPPP